LFQAEDGIRDRTVTGVQTCALPIWNNSASHLPWRSVSHTRARTGDGALSSTVAGTGRVGRRMTRTGPLPRVASKAQKTRRERSKIGRASCRERVERKGTGGAAQKDR